MSKNVLRCFCLGFSWRFFDSEPALTHAKTKSYLHEIPMASENKYRVSLRLLENDLLTAIGQACRFRRSCFFCQMRADMNVCPSGSANGGICIVGLIMCVSAHVQGPPKPYVVASHTHINELPLGTSLIAFGIPCEPFITIPSLRRCIFQMPIRDGSVLFYPPPIHLSHPYNR